MSQVHDPQRAIGRTVARVEEYGWTVQIVFTDDTKLMLTPDSAFEPERVEVTFHEDSSDD